MVRISTTLRRKRKTGKDKRFVDRTKAFDMSSAIKKSFNEVPKDIKKR